MAKVTAINVSTAEEMNEAIITYTVQGFSLEGQTPDTATLKKSAVKTLFSGSNILILVLLWLLCVLPGLLYTAVILSKGDQTVIIRVDPTAAAGRVSGPHAGAAAWMTAPEQQVQWSPDGRYWWDGTAWVDASQQAPSVASTTAEPDTPTEGGAVDLRPDGGAVDLPPEAAADAPVSANGDTTSSSNPA